MSDIITNFLLWGVETDEEVQALIEKFKDHPIFDLDRDRENPFHKPKSEWTEEMWKQYEDFKKKYK